MKVEFHRPDEPDDVLATATWTDGDVVVSCEDDETRAALEKAFRRTPVVVADDSSYRRLGTSGEVAVPPASLEWFRAVVHARVPAEAGLVGRLIPGVTEGGYDPAANYRTFGAQIERLTSRS